MLAQKPNFAAPSRPDAALLVRTNHYIDLSDCPLIEYRMAY
jgi:hypothetical protein